MKLSQQSQSYPEKSQDQETTDADQRIRAATRQETGTKFPGCPGEQRQELIDGIGQALLPGQQVEHALANEAETEHFNDGPQGAEEKEKHPPAYLSAMRYSASSWRMRRL